jgi:macrodomain Ter protein organizer (MatP/YcbG family)
MALARPSRNQTILKHEGMKTRRKRTHKKNHGVTEARSTDCDFIQANKFAQRSQKLTNSSADKYRLDFICEHLRNLRLRVPP